MNHRMMNQINTVALLALLSSLLVAIGFLLLRGIGGAIVGLIFAIDKDALRERNASYLSIDSLLRQPIP